MKQHHLINPLTLRTIPMFTELSAESIDSLMQILKHQHVKRDEVIVHEGEESEYFYIILTGKAKVIITNSVNREFIISFLKTGEFFGEMGMLDNERRSATVVAMTACELLLVGKTDFEKFLAGNYEIVRYMLKSFSHRMRTVIRKIESLAMMDVYGRVARVLLEGSELIGGELVFRYRLSKQEFSEMVGSSREMVSRVIKHLEEDGFIENRGDKLIIINDSITQKAA
ncbi:MAG: Crp/Fnr family transcriptional regulator [Methylophilaceae bacterium]